MKWVVGAVILVLVVIGLYEVFFSPRKLLLQKPSLPTPTQSQQENTVPQLTIVAQNLDTPWAIAFLPDGSLLVTERGGNVQLVNPQRQTVSLVAHLSQVKEIGEGGLLGMVLHSHFSATHFVYVYYTYSSNDSVIFNRVVRMTYTGNTLSDEKILIDRIPSSSNHNGGRMKFGPDGFLYITTGDAENPSQAQNSNSLAGKILRVTDEGKPVEGTSLVYSYGHRNPQGLAWDSQGNLWETEHGRSGVLSGLDEVNVIEKEKNYGWPVIQGDEIKEGMVTPVKNSGATTTWAPAGAAILGNSLYFAGLRGQRLYKATIQGKSLIDIKEYVANQFGRLREVIVGPDGMLYVSTSNKDGRGNPQTGDDKILRINPNRL
jgi:glucose/arabinose dehydrogenase